METPGGGDSGGFGVSESRDAGETLAFWFTTPDFGLLGILLIAPSGMPEPVVKQIDSTCISLWIRQIGVRV